jgi:hypothetical protein
VGEIDDGARCFEHADEVFPPRCAECDALRGDTMLDNWDLVAGTDREPCPVAS